MVRPDDAPDIVRRRLEVYAEKTEPLIAFYRERGLLYVIDASPEPETIFSQVITVLSLVRRRVGESRVGEEN
jgi:adenylate kinase